jgi:lysozyme family protein
MAQWTYSPAMQQGVFPHEGGYSNDAADPGGPTNWGITIYDARAYWKASATAADVRAMPKSVAEDIYAAHYAKPLRYDDLPAGVDYAVLDYGINSGIARSAKVLQRLVDVGVDGAIGAATLAAVGKRDATALIGAICDERLAFLKSLSTWPVFGVGWGRRVAEVRQLALHFADQAQHVAPAITPTAAGTAMAKGAVAPPSGAKKAITVAGGGAALGAAGGFHVWLAAHPLPAGLIALGVLVAFGASLLCLEHARNARQQAPTPNLVPVPPKAA